MRWVGAHKDEDLAKMISHNEMKDQSSEVVQDSNCFIFIKRGDKGFAGINKCANDITVEAYFSGLFTKSLVVRQLLQVTVLLFLLDHSLYGRLSSLSVQKKAFDNRSKAFLWSLILQLI